ncbi:hypothetical protein PENSPDRAFT_195751 [Peniophora sp. CONT]|nr:hypothetical protein PENSPDRAFT_195751 [Peniophora sp. CONT]
MHAVTCSLRLVSTLSVYILHTTGYCRGQYELSHNVILESSNIWDLQTSNSSKSVRDCICIPSRVRACAASKVAMGASETPVVLSPTLRLW